jgi:hypothetical protein
VIVEAAEEKDDKRPFSYSYHHRSTMPKNADLESVKASLKDKEVSITAAINENYKPVTKKIPLEDISSQKAIKN